MERPYVYVNMAMTVDGKITSAAREYPKFASLRDRERMDRLRAEADALIVGAGTIRADDPKLHVRSAEMREYRATLGKPAGLHRVLVSAGLDVDPHSRFFDRSHGGDSLIATVEDADPLRVAALEGVAEIWRIGRGRVELRVLLERLLQRGIERLLLEGGGELNWHFFAADLVDEINVTIAPALLGGRDAPTLLEGEGLAMEQQRRLRLVDLRREGDELFCRYSVER